MAEESFYEEAITSTIYLGVGGLGVSGIAATGIALYEKYHLGIEKQCMGDLNNLEMVLVGAIIGFGALAFTGLLANGVWLVREGERIRRGSKHG